MSEWPKERPELTPEQNAVAEDWNQVFSGTIKQSKYGHIFNFDHAFTLASARVGLRTLEIGAGSGTHLQFEPEGEYVALEKSERAAAVMTRRPGLVVLVGDCENHLPLNDDSFDRVVAIHVLEHLYDLPGALQEVKRVLTPEGIFSVVIPCEGGAAYAMGRRLTSERIFKKRYGVPYGWWIRYDHCNSAHEVLTELKMQFQITRCRYFPLIIPFVALNFTIGLELKKLRD